MFLLSSEPMLLSVKLPGKQWLDYFLEYGGTESHSLCQWKLLIEKLQMVCDLGCLGGFFQFESALL